MAETREMDAARRMTREFEKSMLNNGSNGEDDESKHGRGLSRLARVDVLVGSKKAERQGKGSAFKSRAKRVIKLLSRKWRRSLAMIIGLELGLEALRLWLYPTSLVRRPFGPLFACLSPPFVRCSLVFQPPHPFPYTLVSRHQKEKMRDRTPIDSCNPAKSSCESELAAASTLVCLDALKMLDSNLRSQVTPLSPAFPALLSESC